MVSEILKAARQDLEHGDQSLFVIAAPTIPLCNAIKEKLDTALIDVSIFKEVVPTPVGNDNGYKGKVEFKAFFEESILVDKPPLNDINKRVVLNEESHCSNDEWSCLESEVGGSEASCEDVDATIPYVGMEARVVLLTSNEYGARPNLQKMYNEALKNSFVVIVTHEGLKNLNFNMGRYPGKIGNDEVILKRPLKLFIDENITGEVNLHYMMKPVLDMLLQALPKAISIQNLENGFSRIDTAPTKLGQYLGKKFGKAKSWKKTIEEELHLLQEYDLNIFQDCASTGVAKIDEAMVVEDGSEIKKTEMISIFQLNNLHKRFSQFKEVVLFTFDFKQSITYDFFQFGLTEATKGIVPPITYNIMDLEDYIDDDDLYNDLHVNLNRSFDNVTIMYLTEEREFLSKSRITKDAMAHEIGLKVRSVHAGLQKRGFMQYYWTTFSKIAGERITKVKVKKVRGQKNVVPKKQKKEEIKVDYKKATVFKKHSRLSPDHFEPMGTIGVDHLKEKQVVFMIGDICLGPEEANIYKTFYTHLGKNYDKITIQTTNTVQQHLQFLFRGACRSPENKNPYVIVVYSKHIADSLADKLNGCKVVPALKRTKSGEYVANTKDYPKYE